MRLHDKVAVITGSSRGIGKAIAIAFAREGASVTVAARTERTSRFIAGTIHETAAQIIAAGGRALPVATDVTDEMSVANMVQKTVNAFQRIDILVNNAATNRPAPFERLSLAVWDAILRVNLRGTLACTRAVLPLMMKQQQGHIINISSVVSLKVGHQPLTGLAYDVSKAAINRFTIGLAEELRSCHIAVNAVLPDNTATEGWAYLNPAVDTSGWSKPEQWGNYALFVATRDPAVFTGRILDEEKIKEEMSQCMTDR